MVYGLWPALVFYSIYFSKLNFIWSMLGPLPPRKHFQFQAPWWRAKKFRFCSSHTILFVCRVGFRPDCKTIFEDLRRNCFKLFDFVSSHVATVLAWSHSGPGRTHPPSFHPSMRTSKHNYPKNQKKKKGLESTCKWPHPTRLWELRVLAICFPGRKQFKVPGSVPHTGSVVVLDANLITRLPKAKAKESTRGHIFTFAALSPDGRLLSDICILVALDFRVHFNTLKCMAQAPKTMQWKIVQQLYYEISASQDVSWELGAGSKAMHCRGQRVQSSGKPRKE